MKKHFFGPTETESFTMEINSIRGCGVDLDYVYATDTDSIRPTGWSLWNKDKWSSQEYLTKPTARQIRKFIKASK